MTVALLVVLALVVILAIIALTALFADPRDIDEEESRQAHKMSPQERQELEAESKKERQERNKADAELYGHSDGETDSGTS